MEENEDYLILKWGTLKGWCFKNSPEAWEAFKKWNELGSSLSAIAQTNTPRQKELICIMIDKVNGQLRTGDTVVVYKLDRLARSNKLITNLL